MRILIVTDSLGCPRSEIETDKKWTDNILKKWASEENQIYLICRYGLSSKDIDFWYIENLKPDIIICQFGIVDACRRCLRRVEEKIITHIPGINKFVHYLCKRYHYTISKLRNIHYANEKCFSRNVDKLIQICDCPIFFIAIAAPGKNLEKKVYNVRNDVSEFNNILIKKQLDNRIGVLFPYDMQDNFLLSDGHHLNDKGEKLVFYCVDKLLTEWSKNA